jgi:hypothetical protein
MRQGLLPQAVQARERLTRERARLFDASELRARVTPESPSPGFEQGMVKEHVAPPQMAESAPRNITQEQPPQIASAGSQDARPGMTIPLGQGVNQQAGNPRAGQAYQSSFNNGREIHHYANGEEVSFARAPSQALNDRARAGVEAAGQRNAQLAEMAALAKAHAQAMQRQQEQSRPRRRPFDLAGSLRGGGLRGGRV